MSNCRREEALTSEGRIIDTRALPFLVFGGEKIGLAGGVRAPKLLFIWARSSLFDKALKTKGQP